MDEERDGCHAVYPHDRVKGKDRVASHTFPSETLASTPQSRILRFSFVVEVERGRVSSECRSMLEELKDRLVKLQDGMLEMRGYL